MANSFNLKKCPNCKKGMQAYGINRYIVAKCRKCGYAVILKKVVGRKSNGEKHDER